MDELLAPATADRLARFRAGEDTTRRLRVADLETDVFGVLEVQVRTLHPAKPFTSRAGRDGVLRRVTLGDASGEVDLVLWGDETRQAVDGPLTAGAWLRLRGATVKPGYREGVELHLGGCVVEALDAPPAEAGGASGNVAAGGVTDAPRPGASVDLEGVLESLGDTRVVGEPPDVRFQADATLATDDGPVQVVLWDDAVKAARSVLPGIRVRISGADAHPSLEGWFLADGATFTPL